LRCFIRIARKSWTTVVAGVASGSGLSGGAPPSEGICWRQSATSWRPTRSGLARSISRASGTARSGKFVLWNSFQIWPAPSIASGIDPASIAGPRSAPRKRLRVMTVTLGPPLDFAGSGFAAAVAGKATAAIRSSAASLVKSM
jgi:hypothetical protein